MQFQQDWSKDKKLHLKGQQKGAFLDGVKCTGEKLASKAAYKLTSAARSAAAPRLTFAADPGLTAVPLEL